MRKIINSLVNWVTVRDLIRVDSVILDQLRKGDNVYVNYVKYEVIDNRHIKFHDEVLQIGKDVNLTDIYMSDKDFRQLPIERVHVHKSVMPGTVLHWNGENYHINECFANILELAQAVIDKDMNIEIRDGYVSIEGSPLYVLTSTTLEPKDKRVIDDGPIYEVEDEGKLKVQVTPDNMFDFGITDTLLVNNRECRVVPTERGDTLMYVELDTNNTRFINRKRFTESTNTFYVYTENERSDFEVYAITKNCIDLGLVALHKDNLLDLKLGTSVIWYDPFKNRYASRVVTRVTKRLIMLGDEKFYRSKISRVGRYTSSETVCFLFSTTDTEFNKPYTAEEVLKLRSKIPVVIDNKDYYVKVSASEHDSIITLKDVNSSDVILLKKKRLNEGVIDYKIYPKNV